MPVTLSTGGGTDRWIAKVLLAATPAKQWKAQGSVRETLNTPTCMDFPSGTMGICLNTKGHRTN